MVAINFILMGLKKTLHFIIVTINSTLTLMFIQFRWIMILKCSAKKNVNSCNMFYTTKHQLFFLSIV